MTNQPKALLSELLVLYEAEQERIKQEEEGKCFNVFSALQLCSDEMRLHSRLLAVLLNPKANHGLGDKFLSSFLDAVDLPQNYISDCKDPMVERNVGEVTDTTGGRIDVILEDRKQKHAIIKRIRSMQMISLINYFGITIMAKSSLERGISS